MEAGIPGWLTGTAQGDQGVRDTNEPSLAFLCPFLDLVTSTPSPPHPPPRPPRLEAPPAPLSPKLGGVGGHLTYWSRYLALLGGCGHR